MIDLPWFFAFDHLPSPGSLAVGDGAMSTMSMELISTHDGRRWIRAGINNAMVRTVPAGTEFTAGIRLYRHSTNTGSDWLFDFQDAGGASMISLFVNGSTSRFEVRRGSTVLATSDIIIPVLTAMYVEFHVVIHDTTGEYELRIDGKTELSGSGVDTNNTASTNCEQIRYNGLFGTGGGGTGVDYTDLYIKGVPGAEGDFYGPILLEQLLPTSDVAAGWTPSTGTDNFAMVDEAVTDQGTTYVETDAAATDDLYGLEDLAKAYDTILALVVMTIGNALDGGAPTVRHVLDDGSNEDAGAARTLGAGAYANQATVFTEAPDAGAWDATKVDAVRLGIRSA